MWQHPDLPVGDNRLNLNRQASASEKRRESHRLRESWRRKRFASFKASTRRDASFVQAVQYDEGRLKSTRTLFRTQDTHGRAVMTGAVVSDARLHVIDP